MSFDCEKSRLALHKWKGLSLADYQKLWSRKSNGPELISPPRNLFEAFTDDIPGISDDAEVIAKNLPTVSDCAVHLELLQTFYVLRQRILKSQNIDDTLGIAPKTTYVYLRGRTRVKDNTLWDRRQVKWTVFVEMAVVRFLAWVKACEDKPSSYNLPPPDILLVWHAFLLNPLLFRNRCETKELYRLSFPWDAFHKSLDERNWTFTLSKRKSLAFRSVTGLAADLHGELSMWNKLFMAPLERRELVTSMKDMVLSSRPSVPVWVSNLPPKSQIRRHFEALLGTDDLDLAVQLRDAVLRQGSFVEKMNSLLWIRSPGVYGTLERAIDRYGKFLDLMRLYPTMMLVPTLDVDLVWHTHQCTPVDYLLGTRRRAGRFINHDDTIVQQRLDDGFARTRDLFQVHFGKEYRICGCWYCELLLSTLESQLRNSDAPLDMEDLIHRVGERVESYRAMEKRRRK